MGGFLRFALLFVALVAVLVLVALPLALGPLLTQQVRDAGLAADSVQVSVGLFDPGLVFGRARSVEIDASNITESPAEIGSLQLTLHDVALFDRTFESISGELHDVSLTTKDATLTVDTVDVSGPADAASTTGRLSVDQAQNLIMAVARRQGVALDGVTFSDAGVTVAAHGLQGTARLTVSSGALLLDTGLGDAIVLAQAAPSDPWQLDEAWVSASGLNVRGTVNMRRLMSQLAGTN